MSMFNKLLEQLAQEHAREVNALQKELKDAQRLLTDQSADTIATPPQSTPGQVRHPAAVEAQAPRVAARDGTATADTSTTLTVRVIESQTVAAHAEETEKMCGSRMSPGNTTPGVAAAESGCSPAPSYNSSSGGEHGPGRRVAHRRRPTEKRGANEDDDFLPAMNWKFEELPEEKTMAGQLASCCPRSICGRVCDVSRWISWWAELKEPERKDRLNKFVASSKFDSVCLFVIFLNTLYIAVTTDWDIEAVKNDPAKFNSTHKNYRIAFDILFTSFYTIELLLKILAHRAFFFMNRDWKWNVFDTMLVAFSIADVVITVVVLDSGVPSLTFMRALRILKITRVMRMVRAVKWVQELRLMLDCVLNSMFHLVWCLSLIMLVLIMFSMLLVQGETAHLASFEDNMAKYDVEKRLIKGRFDSITVTMLTLFKSTTGGLDWENAFNIVARAGPAYEIVFLFYIAFFAIVAWNIVMSTFVEKAFKLAVPDIDTMMMEKRRKDLHYSRELTQLINMKLDQDHNGRISLQEFRQHLSDPEMIKFCKAHDFDLKDAELFFHMLASVNDKEQKQEVDVKTFVMGCMKLRGMANNIDLQALHYDMRKMHGKLLNETQRLKELIVDIQETGTSSPRRSLDTASPEQQWTPTNGGYSYSTAALNTLRDETCEIRV